jgi:hypothetical protein
MRQKHREDWLDHYRNLGQAKIDSVEATATEQPFAALRPKLFAVGVLESDLVSARCPLALQRSAIEQRASSLAARK